MAQRFSLSVTAEVFYCAHTALMGHISQLQQEPVQAKWHQFAALVQPFNHLTMHHCCCMCVCIKTTPRLGAKV